MEKTPMIWTKSMEGGIPYVDAQHKELFRQVEMLLKSEEQERVLDILTFLERYVVEHFNTEEVLHWKSGYAKAEEHRMLHCKFTATFLELKEEYRQSGYNLTILLKISRVVVAWLKEHVMGADMDFANHYHGNTCSLPKSG